MRRTISCLIPLVLACAETPTEELTEHAARALAEAASDDDFTVPMNDLVLARLQDAMGPRRAYFEAALLRSRTVAPPITAALEREGLPSELLAVVLVESGFEDIAARPPTLPGAGLWQFIPETARAYGLKVDGEVDERHDPARSTDAALRLLGDLHERLGTWELSFAAYNQGEPAVRAAIAAEGTDDAWAIIEAGALQPYAADVMAGVILLEGL